MLTGVQWWLIFEPVRTDQWAIFHKFGHVLGLFDAGENHVWGFSRHDYGNILIVNPSIVHLRIGLRSGEPKNIVKALLDGGHTVFSCHVPPITSYDPSMRRRWHGVGITCASVMAYSMGLERYPMTPRGLKRLIVERYNGTELRWRR